MKKKSLSILLVGFLLFSYSIPATKPHIEWVEIPEGVFIMGSPSDEKGRESDESQHKVRIAKFKISKNEITVGQFKAFVEATGYLTDAEKSTGGMKGCVSWPDILFEYKPYINWRCDERGNIRPESEYNHPVVFVSWNDAVAFSHWMGCRLPTEAEWEYACRAGTETPYNTGDRISLSDANYYATSDDAGYEIDELSCKTVSAGSFASNAWGLYDMHGNVQEWCSDWYDDYQKKNKDNPKGNLRGLSRVSRGGSWGTGSIDCRSAKRYCHHTWSRIYDLGFRIVSDEVNKNK